MKPASNKLKEQIAIYKKNGKDISDLIKGIDIKGLDLGGAIIKSIDVSEQHIEGTNFTNATIGTKDNIVYFNKAYANGCSFIRTQFPGKVMARRADFKHCNFKGAFAPYFDYRHADFRNCNFCDCVFSIGTERAYGALFSEDLFKDLAKFWGIEISIKSMEEK